MYLFILFINSNGFIILLFIDMTLKKNLYIIFIIHIFNLIIFYY